jgi:hypothetical protein
MEDRILEKGLAKWYRNYFTPKCDILSVLAFLLVDYILRDCNELKPLLPEEAPGATD